MRTWLQHHHRALAHALLRLWTAPVNTLFAVLVVGITLALPAGGEMLMASLVAFGRHVATTPQISVFLTLDASHQDAATVETRLRQDRRVGALRFVSKQETLQRFRESEGLAEVIDDLPQNPFPDAFVVTPRGDDPGELDALRSTAAQWPKVEHVQLDSAWAKRLAALLEVGRLSVLLLAGLLGVAIVAVSFNTIRLQILTQRTEIDVSRLLGATDGYIRRPFYYFGTLQGLLGGAAAWLIVFGATVLLRDPFAQLGSLYGMSLTLQPLPPAQSAILIGFAALLGWIGARLSVSRHLYRPESG
jgi:cell division transport system permease protein